MSAADVLKRIKDEEIAFVDLRFCDTLGKEQHVTLPANAVDDELFEDGKMFDGSSISGWKGINESDMILMPEPATAVLDPFSEDLTLNIRCDVLEPSTMEAYSRCPRSVAKRAEEYLKSTGYGDAAFFGPEPEFFVFDEVRYEQTEHRGFYQIDSVEGAWNTARFEEPNLGYKPSYKGGYFPVSPTDTYHDLRGDMVYAMRRMGIVIEAHHHEVGTAGQCEIDMKYAPLLTMADQFMWYKYIIKNIGKQHGKTVTFMPKPIFQDNGSGMHTHLSLWKKGKPLFAGDGYAHLSEAALHGIGGLLHHAPAVLAFAAPTHNSYRRLVPGFEAPVNLAMSQRNRSAAVRIPMYSTDPKARRLEFRCPDPSCNGYLAFSAMLMAVLDGIENKMDPGDALDRDIYEMTPEELEGYAKTPATLDEALHALHDDHAFLTKGDVFTDDLIETWMSYKWENEIEPLRLRPHPYEFYLYYDS